MKNPAPARRRGATLPEVMSATILTGVSVLIFGATFSASAQTMTRSTHQDTATHGCQRQMEIYRDAGYASLPNIPPGQTSTDVRFTPPSALPNARGTAVFTKVDEGFDPVTEDMGRVRVDLTITWNGTGANRGSVSLTSMIIR